MNICSMRMCVHGISSLSVKANRVITQSAEAFHTSEQIPLPEVSLSQTPPSRPNPTAQELPTPERIFNVRLLLF